MPIEPAFTARAFAELRCDQFAVVGAKPYTPHGLPMSWEYTMDSRSVAAFHRAMDSLVVHQIPDGCGGWRLVVRLPTPVPARQRARMR